MSKRAREDEPSPTSHGMMSPIQHLATSVELISRRQEQAATQISSLQRQVATLNCRLTASGQQPPRLWPTGRLSAGNPSNTVQALGETQSQAFPETQVLSPAFPETQVYPQAQASPTAGDASAEDVLHHPSRTAEVHAEVQPALDSQVDEESQVQQFGAPPVPISALTPETFGAQLATSKDKGKTWQGDDRVAGEYQGPIPRTPTVKETCDKLFDNKDNWYKGRHKSDKSAGSSLCKCSDAEKHDMMKEKRQRLGAWTPGYCIWCGKVMPAAYQAKEAAYKHLKAVKNYIRHSVNLEAATQAQDEEEEELALNVFHMQSS
jgi:hypothetical protein